MEAKQETPWHKKEYGILQVIPGHQGDVRAVRPYPNGSFLTGSRDLTTKLYQPENPKDIKSELNQTQNFIGPTGLVSAICYGKTKSGELEIYVGSHDMNIYVYKMLESKPIDTLLAHSDAVSTLAFRVCDNQEVLLSGSWDNTAIIWKDKKPEIRLSGHINAVWSVAFVARSFLLTGGADKTIRKWNIKDGMLLNIFEGHTDCVRGLAVVSAQHFLSCSNDCNVIMWTIDGEVLRTFSGHENFIFDICIVRKPLEEGSEPPKSRPYCFVTVSEDKTVKIWDKDSDNCLQSITLQATTLWSVAGLDNGNFAVGTSDGHTYVFSHVFGNESSQAEPNQ